jgi:hypothetical protein
MKIALKNTLFWGLFDIYKNNKTNGKAMKSEVIPLTERKKPN